MRQLCLLAVGCLLLLAASCDHSATPPAPAASLVGGRWYVTERLLSPPNLNPLRTETLSYPACKQDDYFVFETDGRFSEYETGLKCADATLSPSPNLKSSWSLSTDSKTLTITYNGQRLTTQIQENGYFFFPPESKVSQIDASTIKLEGVDTDYNFDGFPDRLIITLVRK